MYLFIEIKCIKAEGTLWNGECYDVMTRLINYWDTSSCVDIFNVALLYIQLEKVYEIDNILLKPWILSIVGCTRGTLKPARSKMMKLRVMPLQIFCSVTINTIIALKRFKIDCIILFLIFQIYIFPMGCYLQGSKRFTNEVLLRSILTFTVSVILFLL